MRFGESAGTRKIVGVAVALVVVASGCSGPKRSPSATATPESPTPSAGVEPTATPTLTPSATPRPAPTKPATPPATAKPPTARYRYAFPVVGLSSYSRTHATYPATDILAACGLSVRAVTDGVVLEVNRVDRWDASTDNPAWRGGLFVSILGTDGVRYYGSHFSSITAGLAAGQRVAVGQTIGRVGTTGHSGACHLHFGISPPCQRVGDWSVRRGVVWPWRYLDAWRAGSALSPVAAVAAWLRANGCP